MTAREREELARRIYRITVRGTKASTARTHALQILPFYAADATTRDGFRHLADWLWMDRQHVLPMPAPGHVGRGYHPKTRWLLEYCPAMAAKHWHRWLGTDSEGAARRALQAYREVYKGHEFRIVRVSLNYEVVP